MFAQKAVELLQELQRTDKLSEYNEASVQISIEEIHALFQEVRETLKNTEPSERQTFPIGANLTVHHSAILRNKRIILAYLHTRLERIKLLRWHFGSTLPADMEARLSSQERDFFTKYDQNLVDYMHSVGLDLSLDLELPPKDLYIEVRVVKEGASVMTENGVLDLEVGSVHFLPRLSVESLVRQGVLIHVIH